MRNYFSKLKTRRDLLYFACFFIGLPTIFLVVTSSCWIVHPIIGFDDFALINPLREVHSFADYLRLWNQNVILDLQPVRDAVYWVQIWFGDLSEVENFQLANIFLWMACVYILWRSMSQLSVASPLREVICALILFHPVMHNAVLWAAGTKHILSALFTMLSLYFLICWDRPRHLTISLVCYIFAMASQPINIGFPLFGVTWIYLSRRDRVGKSLWYIILMLLTAVATGFLNTLYFSSDAYANTGGLFAPKFRHEDLTLLWKRFLIIGRDIVQLVLPYKPSVVSYNLKAPESFIGIGLLSFFLAMGWYWRREIQWRWLLLGSLPLSAVVVKLTSQGGVDTYLLTPLLALGLFLATTLPNKWLQPWPQRILIVFALVMFMIIDGHMTKVWTEKNNLWEYAYESEGSSAAKSLYIKNLINNSNVDTRVIFKIADELLAEGRPPHEIGYALGKAIYSANLNDEEKDFLFKKYTLNTPWFAYYRSAFEARRSRYHEAYKQLTLAWNASPREFTILVWQNIPEIERNWTRMCQLAQESNCDNVKNKIDAEKQIISTASRWRARSGS